MAGRKKNTPTPPLKPEEIIQKSMEDVMHDSMIPYSEHVIMERALPRVEDGLKPVQRRILYTMMELGNTPDKPHRKCARIVGDCLGKYHPHGDSSVYDALARMAQDFVMRTQLVDGHGNFGSIDGDSPAAMRYTEARMTPNALLLLQDLDKDTVDFHLNFDDSLQEPDILPGRFPNLLVNGASGIAVGLATNIPTHNLAETIDGAIAMIDKPKITTAELMTYIPAPDFPTGGILAADEELTLAYETGRGKLQLRAKVHIEDAESGGRKLIVIDEIPYQVNKASMLEKILHLSEEKKNLLSGIYDIRDESDRMGMRAVIEVRKDTDPQQILNVLYKYSDLQVTFGVNMVAIAKGKPKQMGLKEILGHFIEHQKNVVTRRTKYDLQQAEARAHILQGLIIAVDNLDEVIRLIRSSKTPKEAKAKLVEAFALTEIQAQAILDMRLQRLTNLEVLALRKEYEEICKRIEELKSILASERKLMSVIKKELREIREKYASDSPRRTEIVDSFEKIVIEAPAVVADDTVVMCTRAGFIKRVPPRTYDRAQTTEDANKDPNRWVARVKTDEKLLFFSDWGNCYPLAVDQIPEGTMKGRGIAIGGKLAGLENGENIIAMKRSFGWEGEWLFITKNGMIKRVERNEYNVRKARFAAIKLKDDDKLVDVVGVGESKNVLVFTKNAMALSFNIEEVTTIGRTGAGVKAITLGPKDEVMSVVLHDYEGEVILCTDLGYLKRCLLVDFDKKGRGGKGVKAFTFSKDATNGTELAGILAVKEPYVFKIVQKSGAETNVNTEDVMITDKKDPGTPFLIVVMGDRVTEIQKCI